MRVPRPGLPPGLRLARGYHRDYLPGDLGAGILVAALAVPQALGYAVVAGVPVEVGLYTLPPALLAYALYGTSRLLFVGPVSTVSVLSGSIVRALSGGDPEHAVALTSALAIVAGVVLIVAGAFKMGWMARFLSEPIVTGFVAGLVVLIVVGEIPGLAGLTPPTGSLLDRLVVIGQTLPGVHLTTFAVGAGCLVLLFGGQRLAPRIPWALVALLGSIAASHSFDLAARGVAVVGEVPRGLPLPVVPVLPLQDWAGLLTGGMAIAAVGIAEGLAAARTFLDSQRHRLHDDGELVANGVADLAAGLFGGMGVAGSLSKTAANARAGAHTQVSSLSAAVVVLLVLVALADLLPALPKAALSAIVINAVWGLVRLSAFRHFQQVRQLDFVASVVAFCGVLALGPLNGLLLAIGQSLLGLIYRSLQVDVDQMGKIAGEKAAWGAIDHGPDRVPYPGVLVLRPDGLLFWANAGHVLDRVEAIAAHREDIFAVVLDLECSNQMDTTTTERLDLLLTNLRDADKDLYLVRVLGKVRTVLERAGFIDRLGPGHLWHSIAAGVKAAKREARATSEPGAA